MSVKTEVAIDNRDFSEHKINGYDLYIERESTDTQHRYRATIHKNGKILWRKVLRDESERESDEEHFVAAVKFFRAMINVKMTLKKKGETRPAFIDLLEDQYGDIKEFHCPVFA